MLGKRLRLDSLSEGDIDEFELQEVEIESKQVLDQYLRSNSIKSRISSNISRKRVNLKNDLVNQS